MDLVFTRLPKHLLQGQRPRCKLPGTRQPKTSLVGSSCSGTCQVDSNPSVLWDGSAKIGFEASLLASNLNRTCMTCDHGRQQHVPSRVWDIMPRLQQFSRPKPPEGDRFWRVQGPPRRYLKTCKTGKTCKSKGWGGWKESWHTCKLRLLATAKARCFCRSRPQGPDFGWFFLTCQLLAERKIQWVQRGPLLVISRVTTPFVGYDPIYPLIRPIFYVCFKLFFSITKMQISRSLFARSVVVFWSKFTYRNHPDQKMLKGPLPWAF